MADTFNNLENLGSVRGKVNATALEVTSLGNQVGVLGTTVSALTPQVASLGSQVDVLEVKAAKDITSVSALLADTQFTYTAGSDTTVTAGDIVQTRSEGFAYQVAASGASDQHVTTAGGVKLYVLPSDAGYNVKAFGAVGNGVADDTLEVQAALTAAGSEGGADVIFPSGSYKVTATLTVPQRVRLVGNSKLQGGPSQLYSQTASSIFYAAGPAPYALFDIRNMQIWGARNGTQEFLTTLGPSVSYGYSTIEGCYLVNIPKFTLLLTGVHFINNNFQNIVGMTLRGSDCNLRDNYIGFDDQHTASLSTDALIKIESATAFALTDNYISSYSSIALTPTPYPLQINNSNAITLWGNRIDGGTGHSLVFTSAAQQISAVGNRIASNSANPPILFSNVTHITFSNNIVTDLAASQPFAVGSSTLTDIILHDNQTNARSDATQHDFVDNSFATSRVDLRHSNLTGLNITANLDFSSAFRNRVITNTGGVGTQFVYITGGNFKPGDMFYFKNTGARLIVYNNTTATAIYDSSSSGYTTGKVFCYEAGVVVASAV